MNNHKEKSQATDGSGNSGPPIFSQLHISNTIDCEQDSGLTLDQHLQKATFSPARCKDLGLQLARAIRDAHDHGVVHGDIKPANVLLCKTNASKSEKYQVKLLVSTSSKEITSLNAARSDEQQPNSVPATPVQDVPNYLSPEQFQAKAADKRSDIYSFACVLYECLTGRKPFQAASTPALMSLHLYAEPSFNSLSNKDRCTEELKNIILRCMQKEPSERYQDSDELIAALEKVPVQARRTQSTGTAAILVIFAALLYPWLILASHSLDERNHESGFALSKRTGMTSKHSNLNRIVPLESIEDADEELRQANQAATQFHESEKNAEIPSKPSQSQSRLESNVNQLAEKYLHARKVAQRQNRSRTAAQCLFDLSQMYRQEKFVDRAKQALMQGIEESKVGTSKPDSHD